MLNFIQSIFRKLTGSRPRYSYRRATAYELRSLAGALVSDAFLSFENLSPQAKDDPDSTGEVEKETGKLRQWLINEVLAWEENVHGVFLEEDWNWVWKEALVLVDTNPKTSRQFQAFFRDIDNLYPWVDEYEA